MGPRSGSILPAARPPVRPPAHSMRDLFGRPLRSLRISVTDRCNMRCRYCMPEDVYVWLPRESILSFEEIERLVRVFSGLGVDKVRLTGGEPLLRHELATLVATLDRVPGPKDLPLTTNGLLLAREAERLRQAALPRPPVGLATLRPERMRAVATSAPPAPAEAGSRAGAEAGLRRREPPHGGGYLFPVPLRRAGGGPAGAGAPRRHGRRPHRADRGRVARPERPRGRGAPRRGRAGSVVPPRVTARRSPPGDAHAGGVTTSPRQLRITGCSTESQWWAPATWVPPPPSGSRESNSAAPGAPSTGSEAGRRGRAPTRGGPPPST